MASPEDAASLLPPCGVCEELQRCLIRLPCHEEHRLCRPCLDTILTLPEPPCPWCRAVVAEGRCELLLFGPVACQKCGETKGAEEAAFCEACEGVFCLRCVTFKHPRDHSVRPFQDPSLLRSSLATTLSASSSDKAAFEAKLAAVAGLLWRHGTTGEEATAEALRERLPGGLGEDGEWVELSEERAAEMTRRYVRLAGLESTADYDADTPFIRQLVLNESAEALAARFRRSFSQRPDSEPPEGRETQEAQDAALAADLTEVEVAEEPHVEPAALEADVAGPSGLSAPLPEASSSSAAAGASLAPLSSKPAKKKKGKGAGISPSASHDRAVAAFRKRFSGWLSEEGRSLVLRESSYETLAGKLRAADPAFVMAGWWTSPLLVRRDEPRERLDELAACLFAVREGASVFALTGRPAYPTERVCVVGGQDRMCHMEILSVSERESTVFRNVISDDRCDPLGAAFAVALPSTVPSVDPYARSDGTLVCVFAQSTTVVACLPLLLEHSEVPSTFKGDLWGELCRVSTQMRGFDAAVRVPTRHGVLVFLAGHTPAEASREEAGWNVFLRGLPLGEGDRAGLDDLISPTTGSYIAKPNSGPIAMLCSARWKCQAYGPRPIRLRSGAAMVYDATDRMIFVIGGMDAETGEILSSVECLDVWLEGSELERRDFPTLGHAWSSRPPLPEPLAHASAVFLHCGIIAVSGGRKPSGATSAATYLFDGHVWRRGPAMVHPRERHTLLRLNSGLLAVGGRSSSASRDPAPCTVEQLDEGCTKWRLWERKLKLPAHNSAAVLVDMEHLPWGGED